MANSIYTETKRQRLATRHAPYWERVSKGRAIGFRKGAKLLAWMARIDVGRLKYTTFEDSEHWTYEDALEAATAWYSTLINVEPSVRDMSVKDAIDHYEQRKSVEKDPRSAKANASRVRKRLSDNFANTKLNKITKRQVLSFRDGMVVTGDEDAARRSKDTANRVLTVLKAALNLAYADKLIGSKDAWDTVKPFENVGAARKLFLTDDQVNRYLKATEGGFETLCRALLLTGNRVGSLTRALVEDFDKRGGTLRLESHKGRGAVVVWDCYLSDSAASFFAKISADKLPKAPLLVDDDGEPWKKNGYRETMLQVKEKSKMPADFNMYAFRHYYISKALLAGVQVQVVAENCGTSVNMIEKHYAKFMKEDRRAMMNAVELGI